MAAFCLAAQIAPCFVQPLQLLVRGHIAQQFGQFGIAAFREPFQIEKPPQSRNVNLHMIEAVFVKTVHCHLRPIGDPAFCGLQLLSDLHLFQPLEPKLQDLQPEMRDGGLAL